MLLGNRRTTAQTRFNSFRRPRRDLNSVAERLIDFQYYWESTARPFQWKVTRQDLAELLAKLNTPRIENTLVNF